MQIKTIESLADIQPFHGHDYYCVCLVNYS